MNKIILNRVNLDGFKLNPIGKQVDKKDFEYLVVDREFKFDKTAGGKTIKDGTARIESIKGNSVVWNQMVDTMICEYTLGSGVTGTITDDGVVFNGTAVGDTYIRVVPYGSFRFLSEHQYIIINSGDLASDVQVRDVNAQIFENQIAKVTSDVDCNISLVIYSGTTLTNHKIRVKVIDLTKMFGAGNEPTTIEEFYARIPSGIDEYAYNEGEVIHNATDKIESVGVNQWDEEWRKGSYDNQGNSTSIDPFVASKNPVKVLPNKEYHFSHKQGDAVFVIYWYDNNMKFISRVYLSNNATTISPNGACYMNFRMQEVYGSTYKNDICINISDPSVNGKYFPYVKREQSLDIIGKYFPQGMKSAGNAHDEIRYNKTTQKWEAVKRIGEVDMGTLQWKYADSIVHHNAIVQDLAIEGNYYGRLEGVICSLYPADTQIEINANAADKSIKRRQKIIYIKDSSYTDAASFKAAMQGVILYYELAEPIVTELDEADQFKNLDYPVWNVGTEKADANVPSTPLKADIRYKILKNKLKLMTLNI